MAYLLSEKRRRRFVDGSYIFRSDGVSKLNPQLLFWRCSCNVRSKDHISSDSLLRKLGINNIQTLLRYNRLRWFGHVVRNDGCINSITEFEVVGQCGRGRPKKTWKDMINNDLRH